jgi:hypothetical protein
MLAGAMLGLLLLTTRSAAAQADTGRLGGNVTDTTGARIPGAKVTALRTESSASFTVTANKLGEYIFPNLQTGHYNVTAEASGFAVTTKEGYELDDQSAVTVNFQLKAGEAEQVIVTGQVAETVNTETGEVSHVIDGDTVRDLALNGRNYLDLLAILPGSVVIGGGGDAIANITSGTTTAIVLNGVRATANGLYIDGMLNKDVGGNDRQFNAIGVDFTEHVKVQTSAFSAQFGQAAGPAINVVTRSGTNSLHGVLFEYLRNNAFDATNYFSRSATQNPDGTYSPIYQHLRFNDFGGAVGGPAIRDKLFYFAGAEWKTIAQVAAPSPQTLPLQQYFTGNFVNAKSGACPLNPIPNVNTTVPGGPNYCNISNAITPFGHALINLYDRMIAQATTYAGNDCTLNGCANNNGNTLYELPQPYRNHEYLARVDYVLSKRQNMYGRWVNDTHTTTNPAGDGALPTTAYHEMGPANNLLLSHTFVFSPTMYNEISLAGLWSSYNQTPVGDEWLKSTYGFSYQPLFDTPGYKLGIPLISIYGYTSIYDDRFLNRSHTTYMQLQDIVTKVIGHHQAKAGVFFGRMRKDQNGKPYYNGDVSFTNASSSANTTGSAVADALLGRFATYTESASDTYGFFRLWQASGFVDDVWRVLPKLSINAGLRYEWVTPWVSQQNNLAAFYPEYYDPTQAVTVTPDGKVVPGSGNPYNGERAVSRAQRGDARCAQRTDHRQTRLLQRPACLHAALRLQLRHLWQRPDRHPRRRRSFL